MASVRSASSTSDEEEALIKEPRLTEKGPLEKKDPTTMWGPKLCVLTALMCQNTGYTLVRRYSMATLHENYDPQVVLLCGEVFKLLFSICMIRTERHYPTDLLVRQHLTNLTRRSGKMCMLALIYGLMNILSYVAIKRIDAAVFTVCAQLKILSTATFATTFLKRTLSPVKWRALVQLVLGCVLVTVPQLNLTTTEPDNPNSFRFALGLLAVFVEVTLSGFASVYFEKVVKATDDKMSVWDRNFQLALHSIGLYAVYDLASVYLYSSNGQGTPDPWAFYRNPFHDFSAVAWLLAILGGGGGLLVALTVKIADSVVKTLAISAAIVTSTIASHYLLDGPLDLIMASGAAIVAISVLNYAFDPSPTPPAAK